MGTSPRIVAQDVRFQWDGVSQRLPKGQVIDVVPGSALEAAIGARNLVPFATPARSAPVVAEPVIGVGENSGREYALDGPDLQPSAEEAPAVKPAEEAPPRQEKTPAEPAATAKKQDGDDDKDGDS